MAASQDMSHIESVFGVRYGSRNLRRRGFTLLELLLVMAIILILTGMIVGVGIFANQAVTRSRARAEIQELHNALQKFRIETGAYPNALAAVTNSLPQAIQTRLNRRSTSEILDPWKTPYVYTFDAQNPEAYVLYSRGAKTNVDFTADDIYSGK